jgi:hypothetical protein
MSVSHLRPDLLIDPFPSSAGFEVLIAVVIKYYYLLGYNAV